MSFIPPDIYDRVQKLALGITNATEAADGVLRKRYYLQLKEFHAEQTRAGQPHPFITEALADYTDDPEEAVRLYRESIALAMEFPDEPLHTKHIALARCLAELGLKEQAEAHLTDGRAEAIRRDDPYWVREADSVARELAD